MSGDLKSDLLKSDLKTRVVAAALLAAIVGTPLAGEAALAASAEKGKGRKKERRDFVQALQLTDEQKEQFKAIKKKYKELLPEKMKAMRNARKELQQALSGDGSEADIRQKFESLQKLQAEFSRSRFEKVLSIRSLLTPEQRQKFKVKEKWRGKQGRAEAYFEDEE